MPTRPAASAASPQHDDTSYRSLLAALVQYRRREQTAAQACAVASELLASEHPALFATFLSFMTAADRPASATAAAADAATVATSPSVADGDAEVDAAAEVEAPTAGAVVPEAAAEEPAAPEPAPEPAPAAPPAEVVRRASRP